MLGLAGCWSAASAALGWPWWIPEVFWAVSAVALVWLVLAHWYRGLHSEQRLVDQLVHPAQGPIAAIVPVGVMLLGAHLSSFAPRIGAGLVYVGLVAAALFAGWLVAQWIGRGVAIDSIHGAYLLPTAAGGLIGAQTTAAVGNDALAMGAFGVGAFFSVVMVTLILARVLFRPRLPGPLIPTLAILVAPSAVGGLAWFAMNGRRMDGLSEALLGITVLMVLVQFALLPMYRRLTFSLGFWSFTFPMAAVVAQLTVWSGLTRFPGWQAVVVVSLAAVTLVVAGVAIRSVLEWRRSARAEVGGEDQLASADRAVEAR